MTSARGTPWDVTVEPGQPHVLPHWVRAARELALGREVVQELHKPVSGNRVKGPAVVGGQQVLTPGPAVNARA